MGHATIGLAAPDALRDLAHADEAMSRVKVLMSSLTFAVLFNVLDKFVWHIPRVGPTLANEADRYCSSVGLYITRITLRAPL